MFETPILDLEPMLRFVRDTDNADHRKAALVERYGERAFEEALKIGLIERQRWLGRPTDFIDLSAVGERVLIGIARAALANRIGPRLAQQGGS